ncbi:MAG: Uma2 family endonuclease [Tepidisphaerales bacterium]
MATVAELEAPGNLAELLTRIGSVPPLRIRTHPPPGMATEEDVIACLDRADKRLCELVDGVLVEKVMGTREALLAGIILHFFWDFLEAHDLGLPLGADGAVRLKIGLVRIPDVCFISWARLPGGGLPEERVAGVVPDLAVEVLSEGNKKPEMDRKLRDYFGAGVRLVWFVQPKTQTAMAYTSPIRSRRIPRDGVLDGSDVLPGFALPLKELFAREKRRRRKPR